MMEWDCQNVILTGSSDGVVRVSQIKKLLLLVNSTFFSIAVLVLWLYLLTIVRKFNPNRVPHKYEHV